jgi:hypothetical protein
MNFEKFFSLLEKIVSPLGAYQKAQRHRTHVLVLWRVHAQAQALSTLLFEILRRNKWKIFKQAMQLLSEEIVD